jgi:hypothetical protein
VRGRARRQATMRSFADMAEVYAVAAMLSASVTALAVNDLPTVRKSPVIPLELFGIGDYSTSKSC